MSSIAPDRPQRADAQRNRTRILAAARECFAEHGVDAQMDALAALAGVGVGTVYRHFPTKDALVEALATEYFERQVALVRSALDAPSSDSAFANYLRAGAALFAENRALAQLAADRPALMADAAARADAAHGFFGLVEELIARGQAAGAVRDDLVLGDLPAIMCAIGSLHHGGHPDSGWRRVLELVIAGIAAPASPALPPVSGGPRAGRSPRR